MSDRNVYHFERHLLEDADTPSEALRLAAAKAAELEERGDGGVIVGVDVSQPTSGLPWGGWIQYRLESDELLERWNRER